MVQRIDFPNLDRDFTLFFDGDKMILFNRTNQFWYEGDADQNAKHTFLELEFVNNIIINIRSNNSGNFQTRAVVHENDYEAAVMYRQNAFEFSKMNDVEAEEMFLKYEENNDAE